MNQLRHVPPNRYQLNQLFRLRCFSSASTAPEAADADEQPVAVVDDNEFTPKINTNKSGLLDQHRNMLHGERPYNQANSWIHQTEKYQRKMFGRYGTQSEVDPRICFPQLTVAKAQERYQKVAEPWTLQTMIQKVRDEEKQKADAILKREEEISKRLEKLEQWTQELHNKTRKREADALAAKQKKERLIEEVRRHFGYKVDPKDERFKEVLEQKDKEERKKEKEAKRKAKENKLLIKMLNKDSE